MAKSIQSDSSERLKCSDKKFVEKIRESLYKSTLIDSDDDEDANKWDDVVLLAGGDNVRLETTSMNI